MLAEEQMQQHITTGCEDLDHILQGGIHCGEVTEVGNFAIYLTLHVLTRIREKKAIIVKWIGLLRSQKYHPSLYSVFSP